MKLNVTILLLIGQIILFGQAPLSIKIKKEMDTDSIFFDSKESSLYSKTSGFANRFKTLKQCNVIYTSRKKSGTITLRKNKLSPQIENLFYVKTKKMEIRFTDIILHSDSLNASERKCLPMTITIYKTRDFHFYFGPRGRIISPFPIWKDTQIIIEYK